MSHETTETKQIYRVVNRNWNVEMLLCKIAKRGKRLCLRDMEGQHQSFRIRLLRAEKGGGYKKRCGSSRETDFTTCSKQTN